MKYRISFALIPTLLTGMAMALGQAPTPATQTTAPAPATRATAPAPAHAPSPASAPAATSISTPAARPAQASMALAPRPAAVATVPAGTARPAQTQTPAAQAPAPAVGGPAATSSGNDGYAGLEVAIVEIKHQSAERIAEVIRILQSPRGLVMSHPALRRITIRDYPENVLKIKAAIERLDVNERASTGQTPENHEVQLYLIATSRSSTVKSDLPAGLEPVINQLQETLRYKGYRYITTFLNRVIEHDGVNGSGITDPMFPLAKDDNSKSFYKYSYNVMPNVDAAGKKTLRLHNFSFQVSTPILVGNSTGTNNIQYQDVGIKTAVQLREGEKVVVGTANLGSSDEAMIVVVAAKRLN
ncbi:MAG: secretin N-terminal domain-containing protein [Blastocatellia bacterium]